MPCLYFLYAGQLTPYCSLHSPKLLFGLLKNAHYLLSEKLIESCSTLLIRKLKGGGTADYTSHEDFDFAWVPVKVVDSFLHEQRPYAGITAVLHWLRNHESPGPSVDGVIRRSKELVSHLNASEMRKVLKQSSHSAASVIMLEGALTNLEATEVELAVREADLRSVSHKLQVQLQKQKCTRCSEKISYVNREGRCESNYSWPFQHEFPKAWEE